jgi:predicted DNA-binding transcriptional regulator AlpA
MHIPEANRVSPSRAIRLPEVCRLTAASRASVWRRVHDDPDFPKPFKLSPGITVWDEGDVFGWLAAKKNAPRAEARTVTRETRHVAATPHLGESAFLTSGTPTRGGFNVD